MPSLRVRTQERERARTGIGIGIGMGISYFWEELFRCQAICMSFMVVSKDALVA
jgi:hypothetical protein